MTERADRTGLRYFMLAKVSGMICFKESLLAWLLTTGDISKPRTAINQQLNVIWSFFPPHFYVSNKT
jgi:hypothetical protein